MTPLPPLRPLEAFPADEEEGGFVLVDPTGIAPHPVTLSPAAFALLGLRGEGDTPATLARLLSERYAVTINEDQIATLFDQLDHALLLDSPRFVKHMAERRATFALLPRRPATLAGESYPAEPEALRAYLDDLLAASPVVDLDAHATFIAVAPHIDMRVGGDLMGSAWKGIAASAPELVVILATGHRLADDFFACIDKEYETPLGIMPTDRPFLADLAQRFGEPLFGEAMAHQDEHAAEFPALFFTHLFADQPTVTAVPILLSFPEQSWEFDHPRFNGPRIDRFVTALRETIETCGKRVTVIASVDFCHVGGRFGDETPLGDDQLARLADDDQAVMEAVAAGDRERFMTLIRRINPTNRLCGFPPLYVALGLADQLQGESLGYRQNVEGDRDAVVGFSALRLWKED